MELRNIQAFIAAAETGSMSRAALRCNVTQSAISQQIKLIEEELETKLFERKPKGILLTESGSIFLKRAREVVRISQDCIEEIEMRKGHLCGELRIGVGSFISPYIRTAAVAFMKKYPDVILHAQFDHASVLNKMLRNEEIDLAFTMNSAYSHEGIMSTPCIPFRLSAVMSKNHELACKDEVSFEDLMKCRIIMPNVEDRAISTFQKYTNFDLTKLPVSAIVSSASEAMMVLDALNCVTFLPSHYTNTSQKLVAKTISDLDVELTSNAHWLKSKPLKASAAAFVEIVKETKDLI